MLDNDTPKYAEITLTIGGDGNVAAVPDEDEVETGEIY